MISDLLINPSKSFKILKNPSKSSKITGIPSKNPSRILKNPSKLSKILQNPPRILQKSIEIVKYSQESFKNPSKSWSIPKNWVNLTLIKSMISDVLINCWCKSHRRVAKWTPIGGQLDAKDAPYRPSFEIEAAISGSNFFFIEADGAPPNVGDWPINPIDSFLIASSNIKFSTRIRG